MKSDADLMNDVLAELAYEPTLNVEGIGISVKDGVVTLNGSVGSCVEKLAAVRATKRLAGVKAIADEIVVKPPESACRTDSEIAAAAVDAIKWITTIPDEAVKATVRNGWLSLDGVVEGWYQKNAAEEAVRNLVGVRGVHNAIAIRPNLMPADVKAAIIAAFERHALLDAQAIRVETCGSTVVLRGEVPNYLEWDEAERAAWAAPGVTNVENRIVTVI